MSSDILRAIMENVKDGKTVALDKKEYHVWSDDCLTVTGYNFSNTASIEENPLGTRPVAIYLKNKKNVCIDGQGAKIIIHGIMTPILIDSCENVVLKNFIVDYARPTMSEFTIVEKLDDGYIISVAKDSLFDIVGNRIVWHGEKGKDGKYLWTLDYRDYMNISMYKDGNEWVRMMGHDPQCKFPCVPEFSEITVLKDNLLKVKLKDENAFFPVGSVVQTRNTVRDQVGGAFVNSKDVTCENLTIRAMHGLGLIAQVCENVTFRSVEITPADGRTIASNADFFHLSNCGGKVTIENCVCSDGHDDFVNVHGTHLRIVETFDNGLIARFIELHSRGFCPYRAGDRVDFINSSTLIPCGGATIKNVEQLSDLEFRLTFFESINARVGDAVENATLTPSVVIKNNKFGPSTGRGILCTTRKSVLIENNLFYKTGGNVLCIEDDCNFWFESGYTTDVKFINNRIIGCGYGSLGVGSVPIISVNPQVLKDEDGIYVHKNIVIENNYFSDLPDGAYVVEVKNTERFVFKNNITDKPMEFRSKCVKELEKSGL